MPKMTSEQPHSPNCHTISAEGLFTLDFRFTMHQTPIHRESSDGITSGSEPETLPSSNSDVGWGLMAQEPFLAKLRQSNGKIQHSGTKILRINENVKRKLLEMIQM
ncbi:hypothetical protein AVEN_84163-1 [Araneus ventricosus]|uniref:Uncharacterized protein n=1 Tax=Araneus ventricosus TaxID=182803 RepID=A0A4Y2TYD4_ARAVE|nr:hypothetical protein AVEN_84163-1 [Araneus ventricosus]